MSQLQDTAIPEIQTKRRRPLADFFVRLLRDKPLGVVGGVIVLILLFSGIFADVLAPHEMDKISLIDRFLPPSPKYLLGADQLGRDILIPFQLDEAA